MSDTAGSHPADASRDVPAQGGVPTRPDSEQESWSAAEQAQPSLEQPYDVPTGAQQYGQPPATGYTPPETDPPGQWAPVQGQGPQQYGQPEHGQASYAQEGFPVPGAVPGGYPPGDPAYRQPAAPDAAGYGAPTQGYEPQAPAYEQQPYAGQQPYAPQAQQPPYPGQQPYAGQQPYPGQPGQQPYAQPYPGQQPYVPQAQQPPYPGQGYPPQPYAAPAPMSEGDQRLWATLTHISTLVVGFVGPLVAYLVLKDRSPFLKESTTEALNFSITASIAVLVSSILTVILIGYVLLPAVYIGAIVLCILAAIAANKGEVYRYPLSWRLVK